MGQTGQQDKAAVRAVLDAALAGGAGRSPRRRQS